MKIVFAVNFFVPVMNGTFKTPPPFAGHPHYTDTYCTQWNSSWLLESLSRKNTCFSNYALQEQIYEENKSRETMKKKK